MPNLIKHIELTTGENPKATIIWMHGLGSDCWDFVPIVKEIDLPDNLPIRFIFPQAPSRPITINNGYVMPGWYDISMDELSGASRKADEAGVRESQGFINDLIAREISRGMPSDKIILAGFSQGGVIALQTALRHKEELGGVLALSTYLVLGDSLGAEKSLANANIPIFMAHGTQDAVIAPALAHASRDALKAARYQVEWHDYPMEHSVCAEEIADVTAWIAKQFQSRILLA